MSDIDAKREAELVHDFLGTELGEHYLTQLSLQYNGLHQAAESEALTFEQKALKVEKAAGVKVAIDILTQADALHEAGYFKTKGKPAKQT